MHSEGSIQAGCFLLSLLLPLLLFVTEMASCPPKTPSTRKSYCSEALSTQELHSSAFLESRENHVPNFGQGNVGRRDVMPHPCLAHEILLQLNRVLKSAEHPSRWSPSWLQSGGPLTSPSLHPRTFHEQDMNSLCAELWMLSSIAGGVTLKIILLLLLWL